MSKRDTDKRLARQVVAICFADGISKKLAQSGQRLSPELLSEMPALVDWLMPQLRGQHIAALAGWARERHIHVPRVKPPVSDRDAELFGTVERYMNAQGLTEREACNELAVVRNLSVPEMDKLRMRHRRTKARTAEIIALLGLDPAQIFKELK